MGLGLITWKHVEDEHYLSFRKLLYHPAESVSSALYHSPPTFDSRRALVKRVMDANVVPDEARRIWRKISKRLGAASEHRGRRAHFGLGYEVDFIKNEATISYRFIKPHLWPSLKNKLRSAQGRGYKSEQYRLSSETLRK
jgi:hypothetical protein